MISIKETGRPRVDVPGFSSAQMGQIGQLSLDEEQARLAQAVNVQDQPSRPLKPSYALQKEKAGLHPVRDLRFTGEMLTARQVSQAEDNSVTIGFADPLQEKKAQRNEQIEPMLGVSPANKSVLDEHVQATFSDNVKKLNG